MYKKGAFWSALIIAANGTNLWLYASDDKKTRSRSGSITLLEPKDMLLKDSRGRDPKIVVSATESRTSSPSRLTIREEAHNSPKTHKLFADQLDAMQKHIVGFGEEIKRLAQLTEGVDNRVKKIEDEIPQEIKTTESAPMIDLQIRFLQEAIKKVRIDFAQDMEQLKQQMEPLSEQLAKADVRIQQIESSVDKVIHADNSSEQRLKLIETEYVTKKVVYDMLTEFEKNLMQGQKISAGHVGNRTVADKSPTEVAEAYKHVAKEHAESIMKLAEYCEQVKISFDNLVLDISKFEQEQTEHTTTITALWHKVEALEAHKKGMNRDAIGIGLDQDDQVTIEEVTEDLQEKHKVLCDTVITIVEQQTQEVTALKKQLAELNACNTTTKKEIEVIKLKQPLTVSAPWYRSLLNVVTASSFFVSGLYYSKAMLPFVAKAVTVGGTSASLAVPYLYVPAVGLCACRIVADICSDYKKSSFDAYKRSWHDYFKGSSLWRNHPKPTSLFMSSAIVCKALVNNCRAVGKTLTKMLFTAGAVNMLIAVGVGAAMIVPAAAA